MSYQDKIPGCFGSVDKIFAGHPADTERAKEMLVEALQEISSWSEVENAIKEYLGKENCTQDHIKEQIARINQTKYFFADDLTNNGRSQA
jgi:hypothetical protein